MEKVSLADVRKTAHEILGKVASICSVEGIAADIYRATLSDYDNADPKTRKEILEKIIEDYNTDKNKLERLQDFPLALIALFVLDEEER